MGRKKQKNKTCCVGDLGNIIDDVTTKHEGSKTVGKTGKRRRNNRNDHIGDDGCNINDERTAASAVCSNWFTKVKWISRNDHLNNCCQAELKPEEASLNAQKLTSSESKESNLSKDTHASLLHELSAIKQQLRPAAEDCANAINSQQMNRTTPEYEFRQARSICNPYESLGETFSKNYDKRNNKRKKGHVNSKKSSSGLSQFVNRSAIKLANLDALLGFCLSSKRQLTIDAQNPQQFELSSPGNQSDYFSFVDLCGAPGGFSEYILYRHVHPANNIDNADVCNYDKHGISNDNDDVYKDADAKYKEKEVQSCYGFGMSLSGSNDDGKGVPWDLKHLNKYHLNSGTRINNPGNEKLETTVSGSEQTSSIAGKRNRNLHYSVCNGADGTGSIYNWDNVLQLQREIALALSPNASNSKDGIAEADHTKNITTPTLHDGSNNAVLVHLVVADGGFDAQRDSDNQESKAHGIIVSQTAAALTLLQPGGTFVIKMFGFQEQATKMMLGYLYEHFDKMTFVKPILSRPASAERYLVCCGYDGPGVGWDGLAWREQLITNATSSQHNDPCNDIHSANNDHSAKYNRSKGDSSHSTSKKIVVVEKYADKFDLDMIRLNLDTLQSIVKHMADKHEAAEQGADLSPYKRREFVDLRMYEEAWHIS